MKTVIQMDQHKVKYITTACMPIIIIIFFYVFSLLYIRMNGKNINFDKKISRKATFTIKTKNIFNIDDIDVNKILVS